MDTGISKQKKIGVVTMNKDIPKLWLHMGPEELKKEAYNEIKNQMMFNKPYGGLWASPYEERESGRYLSDWHEQSVQMGFEESKKAVLFSFKKNARVCVIDNQEDLIQVVNTYPANESYPNELKFLIRHKYIDYEKLKQDYDVIYLTEKGQWTTRNPLTNWEYSLYGWDCASCIVLNFDVIDKQLKVTIQRKHS